MSEPEIALQKDEEDVELTTALSEDALSAKIDELKRRSMAASLTFTELNETPGELYFCLAMKRGRDTRNIYMSSDGIVNLLSINFERFVFLSGFDAICSYTDDMIEAAVRPLGEAFLMLRRFASFLEFAIDPPQTGLPKIELSTPSRSFATLMRSSMLGSSRYLTLKITGGGVSTHDHALSLLRKTADAVFFQMDLLSDIAFTLVRERQRRSPRRFRREPTLSSQLRYPPTEFDDAPISLYW
jgi:hypothetical protein